GRDRKAADQIDDESADRKGGAEALRGPQGDQISRCGAGGAGQTNPDESFHVASPLGRRGVRRDTPTATRRSHWPSRKRRFRRTPPPNETDPSLTTSRDRVNLCAS